MSRSPHERTDPVPARPPTLETVATLAGVSRATVSRVINEPDKVSPTVRATVEDIVESIGYVPNRAARSLVTRRTDSIALVVREPVEFGVADPYLSSLVVAASQVLTGTGIQLAVMLASNDADHAKLGSYVRAGHVDGVILVSVHDDDPLPRSLVRAGIPTVLGGRPPVPLPGLCFVDVENEQGAAAVARRLVDQGRRQLAVIAGPTDMVAAGDRLIGFREALPDSGFAPPAIVYGDFTQTSGERALSELLRLRPDLDGVFAANDHMAIGAMHALNRAGRRVPDDVAVIGFDDIEPGRHTDPPLTTVAQDSVAQARLMVELVLAQRDGHGEPGGHILPTRLIVRGSG